MANRQATVFKYNVGQVLSFKRLSAPGPLLVVEACVLEQTYYVVIRSYRCRVQNVAGDLEANRVWVDEWEVLALGEVEKVDPKEVSQ